MSARLFAALDLPAPVRDALATFGHAAADDDFALRPVRDDALHMTLAFLGHRPLDDIEPASEAVRAAAVSGQAPADLALGEPLWLAPRRPHVLTVEVLDRTGDLMALQERVVAGLADAIGYEPERRRFRPHVTVARVRHGARPRGRGLPEAPEASFAAAAVTLYRSYLGGGPALYEAVERVELG
jgi:2'-5' RNA ligase